MQFNPGDGSGIVDEINDLCDSDNTSYPIAKKTRRANSALELLVGDCISADGTWQYDDPNHTDLPIGTGTLVEGQVSYSFASQFLDIEEIDILDKNGVYRRITPFDPVELGMSIEEYFGITASTTPTGFPEGYDKNGFNIRLLPAPTAAAVTLASGIKVKFKRTASLFVVGDTTKVPGIPSPWHITLAKMSALPYCKTYKKDRVAQLVRDINEERADLRNFFANREKDTTKKLTMKKVNPR